MPIELLRRSGERGRLAHGYVFFGSHGVGRRLVARKLAQSLFCTEVADSDVDACGWCAACKQVESGNHPDLLYVCKPQGKRELPIDLIAGPPERRGRQGLCYELAMRPMSAGRRVAIVDDAESMNPESANALLKTLEEPPPGSVLILLATSPEAILPTILSRVQPLFFSPLPDDDVADLLLETDAEVSLDTAREIASLSRGSLDTARQLVDHELLGLRHDAMSVMASGPFSAVGAAARLNKAIDDLGGDAATKRQQAEWVFRFLVEFLRSALVAETCGTASSDVSAFLRGLAHTPYDRVERIGQALERLVAAESAVAGMTPVPLAIEGLCDDLSAIFRGADRAVLEL